MALADKFYNVVNNAATKIHPVDWAKSLFKENVDGSRAIVSILESTGISGFQFHVSKSEQIKMENEITDHYIDTNSAVQDHIAQKPVTLTLNGLHGEYFYTVHQIKNIVGKVIPAISLVKQFLPKFASETMKNKMKKLDSVKVQAIREDGGTPVFKGGISKEVTTFNTLDLWNMFQELYPLKSAQTRAFFFFEAMWKSRAVFSVETSWKHYDNMVIQSITALRDNNADITDFTLVFKQLNFTKSMSENAQKAADRVAQQKSALMKKGVDKGTEVPAV